MWGHHCLCRQNLQRSSRRVLHLPADVEVAGLDVKLGLVLPGLGAPYVVLDGTSDGARGVDRDGNTFGIVVRDADVERGLASGSSDARAAVDVQAAAVVGNDIVVAVVSTAYLHVRKRQVAVVLDEHGSEAAGERTVLQLELAALLKVP